VQKNHKVIAEASLIYNGIFSDILSLHTRHIMCYGAFFYQINKYKLSIVIVHDSSRLYID